jgi:hypothetical protein
MGLSASVEKLCMLVQLARTKTNALWLAAATRSKSVEQETE